MIKELCLTKPEPIEARCGRWGAGSRAVVDWVTTQHADSRSELASPKGDHVLADMGGNLLTVLHGSMLKNPLDEIIAVLIASNCRRRQNKRSTGGCTGNKLSIKGIRGRSGRPSQTRSRYLSKNSLPPTFRHFSTTFEAYWSMLYSGAF